MHVVRHEAVGVHHAIRSRSKSTQVEEIKIAVLLLVKALLSVVTTVDEVYGNTRQHDARASRHEDKNGRRAQPLTKKRGLSLILG